MTRNNFVLDGAGLRNLLLAGCNRLGEHKETVNALNVFPVPDGDTGINMYLTVSSGGKKLAELKADCSVEQVSAAFARGTLMGARGNSGVILSQVFRGVSVALAGKTAAEPAELAAALQKGVDFSYKSVMKPLEGTILTVCRCFTAGVAEAAAAGGDIPQILAAGLKTGQRALEDTPNLLPVLKEAGVVDAGGMGFLLFMQGALDALSTEAAVVLKQPGAQTPAAAAARDDISTADIEFAYCTQLLIEGENLPVDEIRAHLSQTPPGDSLLVVGDENVVKIHFHNNHPGQVLEYCSQFGTLHDIIIDNMRDQHHENRLEAEAEGAAAPAAPAVSATPAAPGVPVAPVDHCGVVTVVAGEGMANLFRDLGAEVISGGQTMNPSAEDLVRAVEACPARQVVILPNNSNIIMTAQQVSQLTDKPVAVVRSKYITQGLTAMLSFDHSRDAAENAAQMEEDAAATLNGELTYAVRETTVNGIHICENDLLELMQGEIVACGQQLEEALLDLVKRMQEKKPDGEILSLYYGSDLQPEQAKACTEMLEEAFPDMEVACYEGGQPLYYFLVAID